MHNWRYGDSNNENSNVVVVLDGERVVATRAYEAQYWKLGDEQVRLVGSIGSTTVHSDYEGRWLVQKMTRLLFQMAARDGIDLMLNFAPGDTIERVSLRSGWRSLGERIVLCRINKRRKKIDKKTLQQILDTAFGSSREVEGFTLKEVHDANTLCKLYHRSDAAKSFSPLRDARYFKHKMSRPAHVSRALMLHKGNQFAYMILAQSTIPGHLLILDWQSNSDPACQASMDFLCAVLPDARLYISGHLPERNRKICQDAGFVVNHRRDGVNLRPYLLHPVPGKEKLFESMIQKQLLDKHEWDCSLLAADGV